MLKTYFYLTKPGIIIGNLITAAAGFFIASQGSINLVVLLAILSGTALIIASGCVFNNLLDRKIDAKMERTKSRALVIGTVSTTNAVIYGFILGILGVLVLYLFTNLLTVTIGIVGLFFYVVVYGYVKRRSLHGTLVGSIAGAVPPLAGYVAVSNDINTTAILLFIILVVWQMPHFYSIAILRLKDYKAAKIPVLPAVKGITFTKIAIAGYIVLFMLAIIVLKIEARLSLVYLGIMLLYGFLWLNLAFKGFKTTDDEKWARKMFKLSIKVLTIFSIMISVDPLIEKYIMVLWR